jgi:hypothetical protein
MPQSTEHNLGAGDEEELFHYKNVNGLVQYHNFKTLVIFSFSTQLSFFLCKTLVFICSCGGMWHCLAVIDVMK